MHIIKLNATDSTNTYLKKRRLSETLTDWTTIVAHEQQKGRGQSQNVWESEPGKNLTFSVLKNFKSFHIDKRFLINVCVSLAVIDFLKEYSIPDLSIKWPNDILSGNTKVCGILIENVLFGEHIKAAILGIGLNVNQTSFKSVSNASSMSLLSKRQFNLDELLITLVPQMKDYFNQLAKEQDTVLWNTYTDLLFRKDKPSTFEGTDNTRFMGIIRGVSTAGKLVVELEDGVIAQFDLKQLRLLY